MRMAEHQHCFGCTTAGCVEETQDTAGSLKSLQETVSRDSWEGKKGEALASFLPGVTTAVSRLLTSDPKLGQVCSPV